MLFSASSIGLLVAVPLLAWLGAKWFFQKDTEKEDRRRGAAQLAGVLQTYGLQKTPEFLIDYSVGDYSGMTHKIASLAKLFLDGEEAVVKEFQQVYERVLDAKLRTPEGRAYLAARLSDAAQTPSVDSPMAKPVERKVAS